MTVIFPMDDEPFDAFLQRQAPKGWTLTAAKHGNYQVTTDDGLTAIINTRSQVSSGWNVKVRDTGISREFTVTAPDGRFGSMIAGTRDDVVGRKDAGQAVRNPG